MANSFLTFLLSYQKLHPPVTVAPEIASTSLSFLSILSGSLFDFDTYIPTNSPLLLSIFSSLKLLINQSSVISAPNPAVSA